MDLVTLYHQANDAWNRHDRDAYVALYADDCEIVTPGSTGKGHQGVLDFWTVSAGPFPDNRATPRTVVVDGTTVIEESVWEDTNTRSPDDARRQRSHLWRCPDMAGDVRRRGRRATGRLPLFVVGETGSGR